MYLTRFWINAARRGARKLLASPQAMHAAVLTAFHPGQPTTTPDGARVLWRTDRSGANRIALYVVSPEPPDLEHLVEQAGWPSTQTYESTSYDRFLDKLDTGQQWAFRLTANPVSNRIRPEGNGRSMRAGHVTAAQQRTWLLDRAERAGFVVPIGDSGEADVIVRDRDTLRFRRAGERVTLRVATYDGRLEITDPTAVRRTLVGGLGHGKAYGCGLMTLAPVGP